MTALPARLRRRARRARRRALAAARSRGRRIGVELSKRGVWTPPVTGTVEEFGRTVIEGWVTVPAGAPPVQVTLTVRRLVVARTWAVPHGYRNGPAEIRRFRFLVRDLWDHLRATDTIVIRANRTVLPIHRHGMSARAGADGRKSFAALAERVREGWVFSKGGRLQRPKSTDTGWQRDSLGFADEIGRVLAVELGLEWFTSYGALLGAVRDGGFIDHDNDVDISYISAHSTGPAAADELRTVALELIDRGYWVRCLATHLSVRPYEGWSRWLDIFHVYFDGGGVLRFPFGVAGTTTLTRDGWAGTRRMPIAGGELTVPVNADEVVQALYGANWRQPDPGFAWWLDRTDRAKAAHLSAAALAEVYWANFWAHTPALEPSSFFAWVAARVEGPVAVVDLGCGAGRDAGAFAAAGLPVLGVDRCPVAVRRARALELDPGAVARFEVCDVGDADVLRKVLSDAPGREPTATSLFYARFLLHVLSAPAQDALLDVLAEVARPGDLVAAEFRTTSDAKLSKAHADPVRRFQDGTAVVEQLRARGFGVVADQEGRGLAPYRHEDPALYRVLARRGR